MKTFSFSQATVGFELSCRARHLSPNTIEDYTRTLRKFSVYLKDDLPVDQINSQHIEGFLANQKVSKKSLLNYFIGMSALWTWCLRENLVEKNVVKVLTPPKPEKRKVDPYAEEQVRALLAALGRSKVYTRAGGKSLDHELGHEDRNRAIIMVLLDTGLRATELCDLLMEDLDVKAGRLRVKHGKGDKERYVPFSPRTGQTLWKYLARRKDTRPDDPVFITRNDRPLTRTELAHTLAIVGTRAKVTDVHPHRFRHTFAINFLRNGGDAYSLQEILGHSTMEMVKLYLKLAESDIAASHRRASPVDHWRL